MHKRTLLVIIGAALASIYGLYLFLQKDQYAKELVLHGNVDIRQVDLGFRVSGRLISVKVEEGAAVKAGDVLAQLDKTPFEYEFKNQQAQVEEASANLAKFNAGSRPQEIQQAKALVKEREAAHFNAKLAYDRQKELLRQNLTSRQAFDDAYAQENETQAQLKTAQEALALAQEGFRSEDIAAASAAFEAAKARLENAQINLNDTTLVAPLDGIVLTRIREPGSIMAIGNPVYTLSIVDPIWIRAYVSEINLGYIKPGMKVSIYTDTYPDTPLEGHIGFISPQAEFTPKNIETKELRTELVYRIRISTHDPNNILRQGMPVTITIPKSQIELLQTKQKNKMENE